MLARCRLTMASLASPLTGKPLWPPWPLCGVVSGPVPELCSSMSSQVPGSLQAPSARINEDSDRCLQGTYLMPGRRATREGSKGSHRECSKKMFPLQGQREGGKEKRRVKKGRTEERLQA